MTSCNTQVPPPPLPPLPCLVATAPNRAEAPVPCHYMHHGGPATIFHEAFDALAHLPAPKGPPSLGAAPWNTVP